MEKLVALRQRTGRTIAVLLHDAVSALYDVMGRPSPQHLPTIPSERDAFRQEIESRRQQKQSSRNVRKDGSLLHEAEM
jgi:hypothetical protein